MYYWILEGGKKVIKRIMLITGTSKGIGRFLAEYNLQKEYIVVGCSRSLPENKILNANYYHYTVDVTNENQVKEMIQQIDKKFGRLDILINNVGVASMNHFLLTPLVTVEKLFQINFVATFIMSREATKIMMRNKFGRIINFTTVAVPLHLEGEAVYAAVKGAIENLTKILSKELSKFGITSNAIGPAPIETDLIKNVPKEKIQKIIESLAIKRLGKFQDVANVVDFFVDEKSDFVTGQIIYLGGP